MSVNHLTPCLTEWNKLAIMKQLVKSYIPDKKQHRYWPRIKNSFSVYKPLHQFQQPRTEHQWWGMLFLCYEQNLVPQTNWNQNSNAIWIKNTIIKSAKINKQTNKILTPSCSVDIWLVHYSVCWTANGNEHYNCITL
jgi:hypothetical protein